MEHLCSNAAFVGFHSCHQPNVCRMDIFDDVLAAMTRTIGPVEESKTIEDVIDALMNRKIKGWPVRLTKFPIDAPTTTSTSSKVAEVTPAVQDASPPPEDKQVRCQILSHQYVYVSHI